MILTFNLFESFISTDLFEGPRRQNMITENFLDFYKEYFLFKVISKGKLHYMNFNDIVSKDYELIHDMVFDFSHINGYLAELAKNSSAFKENWNYVILDRDNIIREESIERTFVSLLFSKRKLFEFKNYIKIKELNTLDGLLPRWLKLVKFENYRSDNIVDDISDLKLLNSKNPFVKLIMDKRSFFMQPRNKLILHGFFNNFRIRLHYQISEIIELQKTILKLLVEEKVITSRKVLIACL